MIAASAKMHFLTENDKKNIRDPAAGEHVLGK
jgi:hypothetical protein